MKVFLFLLIQLPDAFVNEPYKVDVSQYIENGSSYHYELFQSKLNTWQLSEKGELTNSELLEPGKDLLEIYYCSDITCGVDEFGVNIANRNGQGNTKSLR